MKRLSIAVMTVWLLAGGIGMISHTLARASDLDDGISKYTDDSVSSYDELGKPDKNIKFIIENAKSKAKVAQKNADKGGTKTGSNSGDNNTNSVVMGAGSNVHGDIIIIDEGKNK